MFCAWAKKSVLLFLHWQSELDNTNTQYQSDLSEWKGTESKLEAQLSELERERQDLIEKADTLSHEVDKSQSQFKEMEATNIENKEKVQFRITHAYRYYIAWKKP